MLTYCRDKWVENEKHLKEIIRNSTEHNNWSYASLVDLVVKEVFNHGDIHDDITWAIEEGDIVEIDHGEYQGTLLYLIHIDTYQPDNSDYLIGFVCYGSCCVCDTLQRIQSEGDYDGLPTEEQVNDYMTVCRHIVTNFKRPFAGYNDELFEDVIYDVTPPEENSI